MYFKQSLDRTITDWNLLKHSFYQAWSDGTLPQEGLRTYAREYGAFIALIPDGWQTLADEELAQEERDHLELWEDFAEGLETSVGEAQIPQVKNLLATAQDLFATPATALGALYAFEAQQPDTAKSKLEGLKAFYNLPQTVEPYFEIHADNAHEVAKLLEQMNALPPADLNRALDACEQMSSALWDALSGICETAH